MLQTKLTFERSKLCSARSVVLHKNYSTNFKMGPRVGFSVQFYIRKKFKLKISEKIKKSLFDYELLWDFEYDERITQKILKM